MSTRFDTPPTDCAISKIVARDALIFSPALLSISAENDSNVVNPALITSLPMIAASTRSSTGNKDPSLVPENVPRACMRSQARSKASLRTRVRGSDSERVSDPSSSARASILAFSVRSLNLACVLSFPRGGGCGPLSGPTPRTRRPCSLASVPATPSALTGSPRRAESRFRPPYPVPPSDAVARLLWVGTHRRAVAHLGRVNPSAESWISLRSSSRVIIPSANRPQIAFCAAMNGLVFWSCVHSARTASHVTDCSSLGRTPSSSANSK